MGQAEAAPGGGFMTADDVEHKDNKARATP